jgi:hypothetical protein
MIMTARIITDVLGLITVVDTSRKQSMKTRIINSTKQISKKNHVCKSRGVPLFMRNIRRHTIKSRPKIQRESVASRERVRWEPIGKTNPPNDQMTKRYESHQI